MEYLIVFSVAAMMHSVCLGSRPLPAARVIALEVRTRTLWSS